MLLSVCSLFVVDSVVSVCVCGGGGFLFFGVVRFVFSDLAII